MLAAGIIDISANRVLEPAGSDRRLLQDWLISAKHCAADLIGRPLLAQRFEIGTNGEHHGKWLPEKRTVVLAAAKVERLMWILSGRLRRASAGVQRDRAVDAAGMDASGVLHEFVHSAAPEDPSKEAYLRERRMGVDALPASLAPDLSHDARTLLWRLQVQSVDEAVVQGETLQILRPWAKNTGLDAEAPGLVETALRSYSYAGMVAMLHGIMDATPVARRERLQYLVAQGSGLTGLEITAADFAGRDNPRGATAMQALLAEEMFQLRVRWTKRQGGLVRDGQATAERVIRSRDEMRLAARSQAGGPETGAVSTVARLGPAVLRVPSSRSGVPGADGRRQGQASPRQPPRQER